MFNQQDQNVIHAQLAKQEHKDIAIRMFAMALLGSTSITAPEIQKCLMLLENYLTPSDDTKKEIKPRTDAQ